MTGRQTRAERAAHPLARDSIRKIAEASGGCLRPVQLRRTDTQTGETVSVMVPCGVTLASICSPCAERAKALRAAQCLEGWHLEDEPDLSPAAPDELQEFWLTLRAEAQLRRDTAAAAGQDTTAYDELIGELDTEITHAGIRGKVATSHSGSDGRQSARRSRSTRRRQDAASLPARKIAPRTTGRVYTAADGKRYRPSMFLTLNCDSYGRVREDGTPAEPAAYDYTRAARDAIHFAALLDRFIQNLRRVLGYEAQYFGGVEPQRRLAPHIHLAVRGSVPRPLLRQVLAATYHQVWWPASEEVRFAGDVLPVWDEDSGNYVDPASGEVLQTWDEALDAIGPADQPRHVARFGPRFDAQGVLAGSKDADRCIGYLTKYLTKRVAECHMPETDAQRAHADRLGELPVSAHARRLIATCFRLGKLPELADLRLAAWAHMLGFRGHFSTKSRHYSTTFGALRAERAQYQRDHAPTGSLWPEPEDDTTLVLAHWRFTGQGHPPMTPLSGDVIRSGAPPPEPPEGGQP